MIKNTLKLLLFLAGCCFSLTAFSANGIASALIHFQEEIGPIWDMLIAASRLMAIWFCFTAIYKLKVYGRMTAFMSQNASLLGPLAYLLVSAVFWYLPYTLDTAVETFWAYDYSGIKSYISLETATWEELITPVIMIIRMVGLIAFLRGWMVLVKTVDEGSQPGSFSRGVVHIIGGIFAINIVGTVELLKATFTL